MPTAVSGAAVTAYAFDYESEDGRTGKSYLTNYFGDPNDDSRPGPQAVLVRTEPHYVIPPHFHRVDQFQVVVDGSGRIGKHAAGPMSIHYTDGFSPYGPITADAGGIAYYTLRVRPDIGAHWMPGARDQMPRRAGRNLIAEAGIMVGDPPAAALEVFHPIPRRDDGLFAKSYRLPAAGEAEATTGEAGDGQYYIVVNGSMLTADQELIARSLVFVDRGEDPPAIRAGSSGLDLLVLQFPHLPA